MALKDTSKHLKDLLEQVASDLDKAERGNKAASQRVRTGSIKLEKVAKLYRKESVNSERGGGSRKAKAKKSAPKAKAKKSGGGKAKKAHKAPAKSARRATAKLPRKK